MKFITGAAGRIGNVLVKELNKRGERVKVLVKEGSDITSLKDCDCEYIYGDILDVSTFEEKLEGVDTIFHLAGHINISSYGKDHTYTTNIEGTKNMVDLCLRKDLNMLYTSSIHALSAPKDGSLITEKTPFCIDTKEKRGIYDCSKALATKEVLKGIERGLRAIIIFPTGVTGPYDYTPSFFGGSMIQLVKSGLTSTIGGSYDYVDVRDVVGGMLKALELEKFGEGYILSGERMNMSRYVEYLREFTGKKNLKSLKMISYNASLFMGFVISLFNRNSKMTPYSVMTLNSNANISNKKAREELKYRPRALKESLYDQYMWFKEIKVL